MTLYRNVYYAQQIIIVKFVCLKGSLCWQGRAWRHSLILEQCYKIMKSINRWSFWPSDSPSMHVKSNPHRTRSDITNITYSALSTIVWYSLDYEFIKGNPYADGRAVGLPLPKWGSAWTYLQCKYENDLHVWRTSYIWALWSIQMFTSPLLQITLHLLNTVLFSGIQSSPKALNPLSWTVPGKFYWSDSHCKHDIVNKTKPIFTGLMANCHNLKSNRRFDCLCVYS